MARGAARLGVDVTPDFFEQVLHDG